MSVQELRDLQSFLNSTANAWDSNPRAWLIVANPVWGRMETVNRIAVFDTKEAAEAYIEASKLSQVTRTDDGIGRSFRPDSLLWDYNPGAYLGGNAGNQFVIPCRSSYDIDDVIANPTPPTGECPPMKLLDKPKYGKDFDQGDGDPRSNMDHITPGANG